MLRFDTHCCLFLQMCSLRQMHHSSSVLSRYISTLRRLVGRLHGGLDVSQLVGTSTLRLVLGNDHGEFLDFMDQSPFREENNIVNVMNRVIENPTGNFADALFRVVATNNKLHAIFYLYALKTLEVCEDSKSKLDDLVEEYIELRRNSRRPFRAAIRERYLSQMRAKASTIREMNDCVILAAETIVAGVRDVLLLTL